MQENDHKNLDEKDENNKKKLHIKSKLYEKRLNES